jgi:hypothetical protein
VEDDDGLTRSVRLIRSRAVVGVSVRGSSFSAPTRQRANAPTSRVTSYKKSRRFPTKGKKRTTTTPINILVVYYHFVAKGKANRLILFCLCRIHHPMSPKEQVKPGQKFPTPTPGFGDRVFYETLLRQRTDSAMAQEWCVFGRLD